MFFDNGMESLTPGSLMDTGTKFCLKPSQLDLIKN